MWEVKQIKYAFIKVHFKCSNIGWGADTPPPPTTPTCSQLKLTKTQKTLEATSEMKLSFYQPVSIWIIICQLVYPTSWQICISWQVSNHQQHSLLSEVNGWNIVVMCRNKCTMISFARKGSLHFMIQLSILWKCPCRLVLWQHSPASWWKVPAGKKVKCSLAASWKNTVSILDIAVVVGSWGVMYLIVKSCQYDLVNRVCNITGS